MPRPASSNTPLRQIRALYQETFQFDPDDQWVPDYIFCVALSSRLGRQHEMAWGFLDGPPASGKTEAVKALMTLDWVFKLDNMTTKSMVSGQKLEEGEEDPSLLPLLYNKLVLMADFTTIMTNDHDAAREIMGMLRRAYDSDTVTKAFGTVGVKSYASRFGVLACSTGDVDQFLSREANMGERFVKLRLKRTRRGFSDADKTMDHIEDVTPDKEEWRLRLATEVARHMKPYREPLFGVDFPTMNDSIRARFRRLVYITITARMPPAGGYVRPPEGPARLQQQLMTLIAVRARLDGRTAWTEEDLAFVSRVAYDTIPVESSTMLTLLYNHPEGFTESKMADFLYLHEKVVPNILRQYRSAGLVEVTPGRTTYRLADEMRMCYEAAGFTRSALPSSNYLLTA